MNDKNRYYIGQGKVYAGVRSCAGLVTNGLRYLGNCPELRISHNVDYITHNESTSGQRNKDLELPRTREMMAQITIESWDLDNLALLTTGIASEIVGTTVTNETVRCPSVKGSWVPLANINLSSFTSLGSLVKNTDYTVDLKAGMIYFTPTGGATINTEYLANYTVDDTEKIIPFNQLLQNEYWLRFAGLNTAENNTPVVIDAFRVKFRATEELQLISQEIAPIQVQAAILFDLAQIDSPFYLIKIVPSYCETSEPEPEPDPFIPDGSLIYCQLDISSFRPVDTVDGSLIYCQLDISSFRPVDTVDGEFIYCQLSESVVNSFRPADPPPLDPEIVLLLSGNGDNNSTNIIDSSPNPKLIATTGNVSISTDQSRFGGSSILINSGVVFSSSSLDFAFGSEDFTIEGWVYLLTIPSFGFPDLFRTTDDLLYINFRQSGVFALTTPSDIIASSPSAIPLNQWSYFAVTRSGSVFRVWLNGVSGTPGTADNLTFASTATAIRFGNGNVPLHAYIDEYRITKGVAREITLPTAPF